jgi:glycosyltransferase involved in cell wall biosynthesis
MGPQPQPDVRHMFSVVGTIEPRKNHALILEVFEKLNEGRRVHLTFLGKMGWVDSGLADKIRAMVKEAWFEYQPQPSDKDIRKCVQESRATIYASAVEGFGLPPVESLWLGTPVITAPNIPSLEAIAQRGLHIVDPMDAEGLRKAVLAFLDDSYLESKTREALQLPLPTWQSFAAEAAAWVHSEWSLT